MPAELLRRPDAFIAEVEDSLRAGDPVRLDVPGGRLHIDRPLPFLCVYRRRDDAVDGAPLVHGQGSYLVVDEKGCADHVARLVQHIVDVLADLFGSVLVLELWIVAADVRRPRYEIVVADGQLPAAVDVLAKALEALDAQSGAPEVEVTQGAPVAPRECDPLLEPDEARKLGCLHLGLAVPGTFFDATTGRLFPLELRSLQSGLASALRKALFTFTQLQTAFPADDYRALGRRAMVDTVADADRRLADLGAELDFLLAITPVNVDEAWQEFQAAGFEHDPDFHYRPLAVDPDLYRRDLYGLAVEDVEDPTLAALLRAKRRDLERRVTMLEERGTPSFLYSSLAVYGSVEPELVATAEAVLQQLADGGREADPDDRVTAQEFAALAEAEMARYRAAYPDFSASVFVRDDVPDVMVVSGDLLVGAGLRLPRVRAEALLQHEVGTHTVTDVNGRCQPLCMLVVGLPGYEETQEGLAVLAEYVTGGLTGARLATLAARVLATRCVTDGGSFVDTFRLLHDDVGLPPRRSFRVAMRVHRAGGFTKDAMYLRGFQSVLNYVAEGGRLEPLLVGKLSLADVPIIEELQWRGVLTEAPLRPRWLDSKASRARLHTVGQGLSLLEIAEGIAA
ncbi:MAG: DUF1704 domain-containing protein [Nitriliruptorales bacterium]|nr:DUF1704 domain-containing protein [Nitriliruptorales bacterium]